MGRVVALAQLLTNKIAGGIDRAPITKGEMLEMAAEYIRIVPGQPWTATAPRGSDCCLFMLDGAGLISAADRRHHFPIQAFAILQEGIEFTVESAGSTPASIVKVIAPVQPISVRSKFQGTSPEESVADAAGQLFAAGSRRNTGSNLLTTA
jgi:hypothetical protein